MQPASNPTVQESVTVVKGIKNSMHTMCMASTGIKPTGRKTTACDAVDDLTWFLDKVQSDVEVLDGISGRHRNSQLNAADLLPHIR